jgi:hypothetical protein
VKPCQEDTKVEFDVYKCDHDNHIIIIEADLDRNLADDLIRCPYHKCLAEFDYSLKMRKNLVEDIFWERIDP